MKNEPIKKTEDRREELPEKMIQEFYSKADILYFLLDSEGQIQSSNVISQEKLNCPEETLLGKKFLNFTDDKNREVAEKAINTCFNRGYIREEKLVLQGVEGDRFYVQINGLADTTDIENPVIRFFASDITENMQTEIQKNITT